MSVLFPKKSVNHQNVFGNVKLEDGVERSPKKETNITKPSIPVSTYIRFEDNTPLEKPQYNFIHAQDKDETNELEEGIENYARNPNSPNSKKIFAMDARNTAREIITTKAIQHIQSSQAKKKEEKFISNVATSTKSYILVPTLNSVSNPFNPSESLEIGSIELINVLSAMIANREDRKSLSEFMNAISDAIRASGIDLEKDEEDPFEVSEIDAVLGLRTLKSKTDRYPRMRTSIQLLLQFLNSWPDTDPSSQMERRRKAYMKFVDDIRRVDPSAFQPANWDEVMKMKNEKGPIYCTPKNISIALGDQGFVTDILKNLTVVEWVPSQSNPMVSVPECRMPQVIGGKVTPRPLIPSDLEDVSWISPDILDQFESFYGAQIFKKVAQLDHLENLASLHGDYYDYDLSGPMTKQIVHTDKAHKDLEVYLNLTDEEFKAKITVEPFCSSETKFGLRKNDSQTLLEQMSQSATFWEDLPFYSVLLRLHWPTMTGDKNSYSENIRWYIWKSKPGVFRMNMQNTMERFRWAVINKYGPSDPSNLSALECGRSFSDAIWREISSFSYTDISIQNYKEHFMRKAKDFYENGNTGVCWDARSVWKLRLPGVRTVEKIGDFLGATTNTETLSSWSNEEWKRQLNSFSKMRLVK